MTEMLFGAVFVCLLACNVSFWILSPTKSAASMNAFAAGINSLGLLQSILRAWL